TLHVLIRNNELSTDRLVHWLTSASNRDLQTLLAGTPAEGCFHGAEETLASIRVVLTQYVTPHKYLASGSFSFRDFIENSEGNVWVTWRQDQLQALKPLISCWTDVICAAVLSMSDDRDRGLHLILDELDSLEKLNYLVDAATKGRKKGLRILAGIQSLAQLRRTYGDDDALTLRNSLRSVALFGVAEMDTYTAEEFSRGLGEQTVIRRNDSVSVGGRGGSRGTTGTRQDTERVVSPAEIHLLPNLTGYLKFAGNYPIARVKLQYKARPDVIDPMVMAEQYSKPIRGSAGIFAGA
ncbi:MAG TPA: type IV secretion system DNA-binding domain-containing protein, partial [Ottowia sp.]|nr:type IV secretion system DNA-binding domain-containing protein [Ottowia sp.]